MESTKVKLFCCRLRPAKRKFIRGALPLKTLAQICLMLQIFISFSYVLIFIILETYIWWAMMLVFLFELVWTIITLSGVFEAVEATAGIWRVAIFIASDSILLLFYSCQKWMIPKKFRGTYFSIHLVFIKAIFDLITSYFVWSYY